MRGGNWCETSWGFTGGRCAGQGIKALSDFWDLLPQGLRLAGTSCWKEGRMDLVLTVSAALHPVERSGGSQEWKGSFFLAMVHPLSLVGAGPSLASLPGLPGPPGPPDGPCVLSRLHLSLGPLARTPESPTAATSVQWPLSAWYGAGPN